MDRSGDGGVADPGIGARFGNERTCARCSAEAATPAASPTAASDCGTILQIGSPDDTCLILIQASVDAGDLDLYIDGLEAVQALAYTNVSGYFSLPAGRHRFELVPAGERPVNRW